MFDWNQTNTAITISIPIPYRVDKKKVDYTITDLYVKLNIIEMKKIYFIDLAKHVDSSIGKMIIEDNKILFVLPKKEEGLWKELEFKGSKEEVKQRRKEAEDVYYEKIKKERENAEKKKREFERFVTDQSIKIDDDRRNAIRGKKQEEKTKAENELYSFVKQMDLNEGKVGLNENINSNSNININSQQTNQFIDEDDVNVNYHKENEKDEIKIQENIQQQQVKPTQQQQHTNVNKANAIFNDNDILPESKKPSSSNQQQQQQPNETSFQKAYNASIQPTPIKEPPKPVSPSEQTAIRQQANIQVSLTEKKIPHFAARESLSKEPPYPKSKKFVPEKNYLGQEIEDRNPIWIKERADNFYKNHDFRSAINAYNKALDLDSSFHKCLINRGTCFMCIGEFDQALNDFTRAMELIDQIDAKEKEDAFYDRIYVRALTKTYAVYALKQEYQKALDIINNKLLVKHYAFPFIIPDSTWKSIEKDRELIQSRMENELLKTEGDKYLSNKQYDLAFEIYNKILTTEPNNEKVLSNISLIYLAQENYDETIKCCTRILKIFAAFKEKIRIRNMSNTFEIKILLRRAKCYEIKNEMELAEKDIEAIEKLEIKNEQILKDIKSIKDKMKIRVVNSYKDNANAHMKNSQFAEALAYYDKAVALIKYSNIYNKIDLVKILLNRTGCLIKLTQYDKTFDEFEKILMILSKQKAIADIQSNIILKDELLNLEFLTYVKRAFVYSISNQIDNAINDYTNALKIKPNDMAVKVNLQKLKNS